jgi:hypothetical protein
MIFPSKNGLFHPECGDFTLCLALLAYKGNEKSILFIIAYCVQINKYMEKILFDKLAGTSINFVFFRKETMINLSFSAKIWLRKENAFFGKCSLFRKKAKGENDYEQQ